MKNKKLWKSKTVRVAAAAVLFAAGGYLKGSMDITEAIWTVLAALTSIGFRDAMREDVPGPGDVDFSQWRFDPKAGDEGRE